MNKHDVKVRAFPEELMMKAKEAAADVVATMAQTDDITKRIAESYAAFLAQSVQYAPRAELGYMNFRAKNV